MLLLNVQVGANVEIHTSVEWNLAGLARGDVQSLYFSTVAQDQRCAIGREVITRHDVARR